MSYNRKPNQNNFFFQLNKHMVGSLSPAVVSGKKPRTQSDKWKRKTALEVNKERVRMLHIKI